MIPGTVDGGYFFEKLSQFVCFIYHVELYTICKDSPIALVFRVKWVESVDESAGLGRSWT